MCYIFKEKISFQEKILSDNFFSDFSFGPKYSQGLIINLPIYETEISPILTLLLTHSIFYIIVENPVIIISEGHHRFSGDRSSPVADFVCLCLNVGPLFG